MNKDEALRYIEEGQDFDLVDIEDMINQIFSEFDNRICENCKYHMNYSENTLNIDSVNDKYCTKIGINTPDYFGCNRFKRK